MLKPLHFFKVPLIFSISYFIFSSLLSILIGLIDGSYFDSILDQLPYLIFGLSETIFIFIVVVVYCYRFNNYYLATGKSLFFIVLSALLMVSIVYMLFWAIHSVTGPFYELFDSDFYRFIAGFTHRVVFFVVLYLLAIITFNLLSRFNLLTKAVFDLKQDEAQIIYGICYSTILIFILFVFIEFLVLYGWLVNLYIPINNFLLVTCYIGGTLSFVFYYFVSKRYFQVTYSSIPFAKITFSVLLTLLFNFLLSIVISVFFLVLMLMLGKIPLLLSLWIGLAQVIMAIFSNYYACKWGVFTIFKEAE